MLKVYLKLRATKDIQSTGWEEGDYCEIINDIFNERRKEYIERFNLIRERMLDGYGGQTDKEMATFL